MKRKNDGGLKCIVGLVWERKRSLHVMMFCDESGQSAIIKERKKIGGKQ